jgi:hypothetical protein
VPLRGGEYLTLKLIHNGAHKTLKICGLTNGAKNALGSNPYQFFCKDGVLGALKQVLTQLHGADNGSVDSNLKATAQKLTDQLQHAALRSPVADVSLLKRAIAMFGTSLENKLRVLTSLPASQIPSAISNTAQHDIKALALTLKHLLSGTGSEAENKLNSYIDSFEQLQLFNQTSSEKSGKILIPLPLGFSDELSYGQLFLGFGSQRENRHRKSEGLISIAFLLNLPSWGGVRADFSLFKHTLTGRFAVTNARLKSLIDQGLGDLTQKLEMQSFHVKHMTCQVLAKGDPKGATLTDKMTDLDKYALNLII